MKRAFAAVILLACIIGIDVMVGRASFSGEQASAGEFEQDMKIGLLLPLSGVRAEQGRSAKRGFDLAAEGLQSWGLTVELEDSRCDVEYSVGAVNRLLANGAEAIVGGLCPEVVERVNLELADQSMSFVSLDAGSSFAEYHIDAFVNEQEAQADYFVNWHTDRYGTEPDYTASLAFDVLTAVTMELRDNNGGVEELVEHLAVMEHHGVSGVVLFRTDKK